ncbi:hypothetical protein GOODEAATRI_032342 [Goodea atripinnis]|uniref:Uncharacterized protein n=1 Tax=Goodea atripinnis TaxID=208336 RepID=A0ABV0P9K9_9TELE
MEICAPRPNEVEIEILTFVECSHGSSSQNHQLDLSSVIVPVAWPLTDRLNRWSPSTGGGNESGLSSSLLSAPFNSRLVSSSPYLGHWGRCKQWRCVRRRRNQI